MGGGQGGSFPTPPPAPEPQQHAGIDTASGPDRPDVSASEPELDEGPESTDPEPSDHEQ